MLEMLLNGFVNVLMPSNLMYLIAGVVLGLIMGAIPGLTSTMAIALLVPMTYYLTATQAIIMLLGCFNGGVFGGSISAVLIATPGTPAAAATVLDGFQMAKQGKAGKAIQAALYSSCFGCLFSSVILVCVAEPIAKYAIKFGPGELTVLFVFSLTIIASAAGDSMIKGLIAGILGLLFVVIGMDPFQTIPRFTFGILKLSSGIDLVVMLIGSLALSEVLSQIAALHQGSLKPHLPPPKTKDDTRFIFNDFKQVWKVWLKSSAIGCGIGALPGLGATLASWLAYDAAKRTSKRPEEFGKGCIEGVAASESANNAVCGANMIPLLTMGVPGDTTAAILIGAFLLQGLTPGPLIFKEAPQVVYNIYTGIILSNVVLFIATMLTLRYFVLIAKLKPSAIFPSVTMFCVIGVYALSQSYADIWIMLFFAVIGYFLNKFDFPPACMLIGFILSPYFENNFRLALLISNGSYSIFYTSSLSITLWLVTFFSVFTIVKGKRKGKKLA